MKLITPSVTMEADDRDSGWPIVLYGEAQDNTARPILAFIRHRPTQRNIEDIRRAVVIDRWRDARYSVSDGDHNTCSGEITLKERW